MGKHKVKLEQWILDFLKMQFWAAVAQKAVVNYLYTCPLSINYF